MEISMAIPVLRPQLVYFVYYVVLYTDQIKKM